MLWPPTLNRSYSRLNADLPTCKPDLSHGKAMTGLKDTRTSMHQRSGPSPTSGTCRQDLTRDTWHRGLWMHLWHIYIYTTYIFVYIYILCKSTYMYLCPPQKKLQAFTTPGAGCHGYVHDFVRWNSPATGGCKQRWCKPTLVVEG